MRRWILRPLGWLFGAVLLLALLLAAAIRLDQYVLRWRAERLQADIRSLELRKSTYADVGRVIHRWWSVAQLGPCQSYWCDVEIDIENIGYRYASLFLNRARALSIYRRLGGRPASVFSSIRVREGVVWEKGMTIHVESNSIEYEGKPFYYWLIGNVRPGHLDAISAEHPDYRISIGGGCTGCQGASVIFTSFADPKDVSRLTDLNFDCITRWRPCSDATEILLGAWTEVQKRKEETTNADPDVCTLAMIRVLSREAQLVPLATVIRLAHTEEGIEVTARRATGPENVMLQGNYTIPASDAKFDANSSAQFRLGDRLMLLDPPCFAVRATPENLSVARQGAKEDWSSRVHPLFLPFGQINPPRIDTR